MAECANCVDTDLVEKLSDQLQQAIVDWRIANGNKALDADAVCNAFCACMVDIIALAPNEKKQAEMVACVIRFMVDELGGDIVVEGSRLMALADDDEPMEPADLEQMEAQGNA